MRFRDWVTSNISYDAGLCGMIDSCADDHCRQMRLLQHSLSGWDHADTHVFKVLCGILYCIQTDTCRRLAHYLHSIMSNTLQLGPSWRPSARILVALIGALSLDPSFGLMMCSLSTLAQLLDLTTLFYLGQKK
ncbi:hypothetical protein GGI35DRAFT_458393 [Trichoderma velutinum]